MAGAASPAGPVFAAPFLAYAGALMLALPGLDGLRPYLEGSSTYRFSAPGMPDRYTLIFAAKPASVPLECQTAYTGGDRLRHLHVAAGSLRVPGHHDVRRHDGVDQAPHRRLYSANGQITGVYRAPANAAHSFDACMAGQNERWQWEWLGPYHYAIRSLRSGKLLCAPNGLASDELQANCTTVNARSTFAKSFEGDNFELSNVATGMYVTIKSSNRLKADGASAASGAKFVEYAN